MSKRYSRRAFVGAAAAVTAALVVPRARAATGSGVTGAPVRVLLPDDDNLQYLSFWVAKAAGYFDEEGLPITLEIPTNPEQTRAWFVDKKPDAAVLPPPMYLMLIAAKTPLVLGANLLANDPIDLIVRKTVADERKLTRDMPLRARLDGLKGLRIGIAPHPPPRLRKLFASVGLDADKHVEIVTIRGKGQNEAFGANKVDALYAHTPYLEHALVHQGAVVLVDQNGGEVPALAGRQIHALAFSRELVEKRRPDAVAMVRAVVRAQKLLRETPAEAANVLAKYFGKRDRAEIDTVTALYSHAVPASAEPRADGFADALVYFPDGQEKPSLEGIDLATYVAPDLVREATAPPPKSPLRWAPVVVAGLVVGAGLGWVAKRRRTKTSSVSK